MSEVDAHSTPLHHSRLLRNKLLSGRSLWDAAWYFGQEA